MYHRTFKPEVVCRKRLASLGSGQWTQAGRRPHPRTDRRFSEKAVQPIQVPSGHPGTSTPVPSGHPDTLAQVSSGHPGTSAEVPSGHPDIPIQEPNGHPDTSAQIPAGHPGIHASTQWPSKDTNTYCNNVMIFLLLNHHHHHGHWCPCRPWPLGTCVDILGWSPVTCADVPGWPLGTCNVILDDHWVLVLMCLDYFVQRIAIATVGMVHRSTAGRRFALWLLATSERR